LAVIRDFQADGKNFEANTGDDRGLVQQKLGADRKPVWVPTQPTQTIGDPSQLDSWYRNVDGLNKPFTLQLWFGPNSGVSSFQSTAFFPLDGKGWGDDGKDDSGVMHNFHFTTEIHTEFKYQGGEKFNFTGDDDVWVFINNQLAIDLGGVHVAENASVDIDQQAGKLGLTKGQVYPFDMFQNERHTTQSNFRADTDLEFVDCGTIVPEVPK
jgi:fibro-slime domain-containing protein